MAFKPLVSIIIPAYNAGKTIAQTLSSAYTEADLLPLEIIVINDGSTDNTLQVLETHTHRCRIFTSENKGASAARQQGVELSEGKYIQFLDADDILIPGKIKLQIDAIDQSGCDFAYGDWQKFEEDNGRIQRLDIVQKTFKTEADLFSDFWAPPAALLFTKNITSKISWSKTLPVIQDARYLLDAFLIHKKAVYTPGVVALYRTHQNHSLSQKSKTAFVNDCYQNALEVYGLWKNDLQKNADKKAALIKAFRFCITEFSVCDKHRFNEAINILLEIQPGYIPERSLSMNILSRLAGYRNAEHFASLKRKAFSH